MVAKCANPRCEHRFRYVSEGKLYVFGRNSLEQTLWLCPQCAPDFEIILDGHSNPVLAARSHWGEPGLGNVSILPDPGKPANAECDASSPAEKEIPHASLVEWTVGWLQKWEREHWGSRASSPHAGETTEWGAGAICRRSGVHTVTHHHHRPAHRAIIHEGEMFPACRNCGTLVSFQFLQPLEAAGEVEHIGYDHDFIESLWGPASSATA
jgi:hypothetical protein